MRVSSRSSGSSGPEAQDLVGDLLEHADALGAGEGQALLVGDLAEELLDLAPDLDLVRQVELRVELVDEPVLDAELRLSERFARRHRPGEARRGVPRAAASGAVDHPVVGAGDSGRLAPWAGRQPGRRAPALPLGGGTGPLDSLQQ